MVIPLIVRLLTIIPYFQSTPSIIIFDYRKLIDPFKSISIDLQESMNYMVHKWNVYKRVIVPLGNMHVPLVRFCECFWSIEFIFGYTRWQGTQCIWLHMLEMVELERRQTMSFHQISLFPIFSSYLSSSFSLSLSLDVCNWTTNF